MAQQLKLIPSEMEARDPRAIGKNIFIPMSPHNCKAMMEDRKVMTSRGRVLGQNGDWFQVGKYNDIFIIEQVIEKVPLAMVCEYFWAQEGAKSRDKFVETYKKIYWRQPLRFDKLVILHIFNREGHQRPPMSDIDNRIWERPELVSQTIYELEGYYFGQSHGESTGNIL